MPDHWDDISAYSSGGDKPAPELARVAFAQLLQNIRLENCVFHPDVINALLRRVPGRVEAENYGHDGANKSYFVHDTVNSKTYRISEPVPIELIGGFPAGHAIQLQAGEWTAYDIGSLEPKTFAVKIRARAKSLPAAFALTCDTQRQEMTVHSANWSSIDLKPLQLSPGMNHLKLQVQQGALQFDWFDFK